MKWHQRRWVRQLAAYLLVVGTCLYTVAALKATNDQQCADRRDGRIALRATVTEAFAPGGNVDFSAIPSFADLDPATQVFLNDLAELQSQGAGRTAVRDRILETIPPITC